MSGAPTPPELFTADYVGEPGRRTFFLQAQGSSEPGTFLIEKQQVEALAGRLRDMLILSDQEDMIRAAVPARDPGMAPTEPAEPEWRVGTIGLGYDEDSGNFVVALEEAVPDDASESGASVAYLLRRDQVRAFVLHALAVVSEGRPLCQLCGLPMDPEGHRCPASNGHHPAE